MDLNCFEIICQEIWVSTLHLGVEVTCLRKQVFQSSGKLGELYSAFVGIEINMFCSTNSTILCERSFDIKLVYPIMQ